MFATIADETTMESNKTNLVIDSSRAASINSESNMPE